MMQQSSLRMFVTLHNQILQDKTGRSSRTKIKLGEDRLHKLPWSIFSFL